MINNYKEIWCDDDPINPDDIYIAPNPSMRRVKPSRPVSEPVYVDLTNLEGIQEIEQAKRRERVQLFQIQGH